MRPISGFLLLLFQVLFKQTPVDRKWSAFIRRAQERSQTADDTGRDQVQERLLLTPVSVFVLKTQVTTVCQHCGKGQAVSVVCQVFHSNHTLRHLTFQFETQQRNKAERCLFPKTFSIPFIPKDFLNPINCSFPLGFQARRNDRDDLFPFTCTVDTSTENRRTQRKGKVHIEHVKNFKQLLDHLEDLQVR